eukprot:scaffold753_cov320-Prasinococcus_capsulatus_cf.AAC.4
MGPCAASRLGKARSSQRGRSRAAAAVACGVRLGCAERWRGRFVQGTPRREQRMGGAPTGAMPVRLRTGVRWACLGRQEVHCLHLRANPGELVVALTQRRAAGP